MESEIDRGSTSVASGGVEHLRPSRWQRAGLWRAIAGMAMSLVIASVIVTLEFSHTLVARTHAMNRRIAALNSEVRELREQKSAAERKLGRETVRASENELFSRLLLASDLKIKRLAPTSDVGHAASAVIAISESANAAMVEVSGVRASQEGKIYRVWYVPRRGVPAWITDFIVTDEGDATAVLELPTPRAPSGQIVVTLEDQEYAEAPSGPIEFKGKIREDERVRR